MFVVLRTAYQDEAQLQSYLGRLSISLEARAYGNAPPPATGSDERSPVRNEDIVWSGDVNTEKEPFVTIQEGDGEDEHQVVLATWNVTVTLSMQRTYSIWLESLC